MIWERATDLIGEFGVPLPTRLIVCGFQGLSRVVRLGIVFLQFIAF